jgi:uncharacterized membrane protein YvbJ
MKFCPSCGFENIDDAQFCRNCGLKLIEKKNNVPEKRDASYNSIITKLFFKTDKYSGDLRIARTKTVTIIVFVATFLFAVSVGDGTLTLIEEFIVAVISGLIIAVPTYVIGYIVGLIMDRIRN